MSLGDQLILAEPHPPAEKLAALQLIVQGLIVEYSNGKPVDTMNVDKDTRNIVARACMYLLGERLAKGEHKNKELAHYLHSTPHVDMIINQPERLLMLEHAVIPGNRLCPATWTEATVQFWTGHDTKNTYSGERNTQIINTIICISKEGDATSIKPFLSGERIHTDNSGILVFADHYVKFYDLPTTDDILGATLKIQLLTDMETDRITSVENLRIERTDWLMYRVNSEKTNEQNNGTEETQTVKLSQTICVNTKNPQLSFVTNSKRYKINLKGFVINSQKKALILLTKNGIQEFYFDFTRIYGVHKYKSIDALYYQDKEGNNKKITLQEDDPKKADIEDGENYIFNS